MPTAPRIRRHARVHALCFLSHFVSALCTHAHTKHMSRCVCICICRCCRVCSAAQRTKRAYTYTHTHTHITRPRVHTNGPNAHVSGPSTPTQTPTQAAAAAASGTERGLAAGGSPKRAQATHAHLFGRMRSPISMQTAAAACARRALTRWFIRPMPSGLDWLRSSVTVSFQPPWLR